MTTLAYTVPVAGTDLNAIADPELAAALTAIKTWANGSIDGSNIAASAGYLALKPTSASGSASATSGFLYRVTATGTITLPGHVAGQLVGVSNAAGITTVSGTNIQGVGLSSASSFSLGTPGAGVLLLDDGTNWLVIAGQQDTGWVNLTITGASTIGTLPATRLIGDRVWLRGGISNPSGSAIFPTATMPVGTRPPATVTIASGPSTTSLTILTSGGTTFGIPASSNVYLDGMSYSLSP